MLSTLSLHGLMWSDMLDTAHVSEKKLDLMAKTHGVFSESTNLKRFDVHLLNLTIVLISFAD